MTVVGRASPIAILVLCSAIASCRANSFPPAAPGGTANPAGERGMHLGAQPDGNEESTKAFMQARITACHEFAGGARILIPPGIFKLSETTFTGPLKSPTPIIIQVKGTLVASTYFLKCPRKGLITFDSVNGLILIGGGSTDGHGQDVWQSNDCKTNPNCIPLPASLYMKVQNAKIERIHFVNSMGFQLHITSSRNIRVYNINITSPADSPNTDGMHISRFKLAKVSRSVISTGDDCISIGQGATNVTITKVTCGPGHGISVGSLGKLPDEMNMRGIIVKNYTLLGTTNGVRIKTWPGSGPSKASGLVFSNIVMNNVQNPIIIDQKRGDKSNHQPSRVKIMNVTYQNIVGTTTSSVAVKLACSSQVPCKNVHFKNINLKSCRNIRLTATCDNAQVSYGGIQIPPPCSQLLQFQISIPLFSNI